MSFNVAYSDKDKIKNSVAQGIIPEESFIITNNEVKDAEAYYYDEKGNLKQLVKKTKFESETEARTWIAKYGNYEGETINVKDANGNWNSYNVGANGEMNQVPNADNLTDITEELKKKVGVSVDGETVIFK